MPTAARERRRQQLLQELEQQRELCRVAKQQIEEARERMRAPRLQMAVGYETLRGCRKRIGQIRRQLVAFKH